MKRLIILAITTVAALLFGIARAAEPNALQVTLKSGEPAIFLFENNPEIAFIAESLKISTLGNEPTTYEIDAVESIDFVTYGSVSTPNCQSPRMRSSHPAAATIRPSFEAVTARTSFSLLYANALWKDSLGQNA